jgi:hypothetical protein
LHRALFAFAGPSVLVIQYSARAFGSIVIA